MTKKISCSNGTIALALLSSEGIISSYKDIIDDKCAICQENLQESHNIYSCECCSEPVKLFCGHYFHCSCILSCFTNQENKYTCPLCMQVKKIANKEVKIPDELPPAKFDLEFKFLALSTKIISDIKNDDIIYKYYLIIKDYVRSKHGGSDVRFLSFKRILDNYKKFIDYPGIHLNPIYVQIKL
jgi:hypothetical protein